MRILDDELVLSPSDLTEFAACQYLTHLERLAARGEVERSERHDPLLEVLSRHGAEHERAHLLEEQSEAGRRVVTISDRTQTRADLEARAAETIASMRDGADIIYQAVFFDGRWAGYADFVERVDRPSPNLGDWSYEVADAKLARSVKAAAIVQCCAYTSYITRIQGVEADRLHVLTGQGARRSFRVADFASYFRHLVSEFENVVLAGGAGAAEFDNSSTSSYPDPVDHCAICRWALRCAGQRRDNDHLSLVAGLGRPQARRLVEVGIPTRTALARAEASMRPPRMGDATFERLHHQAALQIRGEGCTPPAYELLPLVDSQKDDKPDRDKARARGLAALPEPSEGDVFLDLEGDPLVEGGLEYLFGVIEPGDGGARYRRFWAHDRKAEKTAFEAIIDLITARRAQHPDMHVYHYAHYEPTTIRRLMGAHGTREAEVDALLRGEIFVDLYQVVRHALRCSTESYSLKDIEELYLTRPAGAVMDAGSSIVAYEEWLLDPSPLRLAEIEAYNKDDCVSVHELRDWLELRRSEVEARDGPLARPASPDRDAGELEERLAGVDAIAAALVSELSEDPAARDDQEQAMWLLAQLLHWHRREEKPAWWRFFDRCRPDRTEDDFRDDSECLGGLTYEGSVGQIKRSIVHRYGFMSQDHKFDVGDSPIDPSTRSSAGTVVEVGDEYIDLKRGASSDKPHPHALIPGGAIETAKQQAALLEVGVWVLEHGIDGVGPYRSARDLLLRRGPFAADVNGGQLAAPGERPSDAACRLVTQLDGSCLAIQGPPGAGKTHTGAHMVLALLNAGKTIGVTAQSHAVISNFLHAVLEEAEKKNVVVAAVQRADDDDYCGISDVQQAEANPKVLAAIQQGTARVAAGTSWLWCDPIMRNSIDVLFVEEAGQRSLADVVAASVAARNVVLLGDPQQLAQVSRGSHPEGAEKSALAHLLGEHSTMPPDLGLFLDTTYRMHPAVCGFISEVVYEGKLGSESGLERQVVDGDGVLGGAGLRYVPVPHEGNATASSEEAEVVASLADAAIGRIWTDENGQEITLALEHVLVVAPYNAQVAELRRHLPDGARVGTVDKFQGQQAPITIYSMASSSADDAPRGMNFLYDLHRLNVALSRARSISIVVCSPQLQRVLCRTPEQMRLANAACRVAEWAAQSPTA